MTPLALLLVSVAAAQTQSSQDWRIPGHESDQSTQGWEIQASAVEHVLGEDKSRGAWKYYLAHCPGDVTKIPRNVQQVCYRHVLCERVSEAAGMGRPKEWCLEQGRHMTAKDPGLVLGELRAETQARTDVLNQLREKGGGGEWGANPAEAIFNQCAGSAAQGFERPRLCWADRLDKWRAPREAKALDNWRSAHVTSSQRLEPPDHLLEGMTGADIKKWGEDVIKQTVSQAAEGQQANLASPELYDDFIAAQAEAAAGCKPESSPIAKVICGWKQFDQEQKLKKLDETMPVKRELAGAKKVDEIKGGLKDLNGIDQPIPLPDPQNQQQQQDQAKPGDQTASFKPTIKTKKTPPPPPPGGTASNASGCPSREEMMQKYAACETGSRTTADLNECQQQVSALSRRCAGR